MLLMFITSLSEYFAIPQPYDRHIICLRAYCVNPNSEKSSCIQVCTSFLEGNQERFVGIRP